MKAYLRARVAAWARRRQGEDTLPVTLHRRRLYVLPTRAGLGFGLLLFCMLIAGLNYANSLALFLTFLLTGFALVVMHQSHRNLLQTTLLGAGTSAAFAGDPAGLQITLGNEAGLPRFGIELAHASAAATSTDLSPRSALRLELPVPTARRGIVRIDRMRLSTTHPFGLFRTWTWIHVRLEVVVYPRPRGTLPMPAHHGQRGGPRVRSGPGLDEWSGLRSFRDGDSPRQVAWKAYARGAPLLVKEYGSTGAELRMFQFHELAGLDVEARLEQLARWILEAEARSESYGLVLPGAVIAPDRGTEHRHRCLTALALHGFEEDADGGRARR